MSDFASPWRPFNKAAESRWPQTTEPTMQSNFKTTHLVFKVAALVMSAAITTLIVGSQLGLAEFYASQSDAVLVAERDPMAAGKAASRSPAPPNS